MQSGLVLWRDPVAPPHRGPFGFRSPYGPTVALGLGLVLLIAIEGRHATADLIDLYLPAAIPGFAAAPGVTVLSRSRPDYDPLGMRLGDFDVRPSASESVGYDSNPSGLSHPGHGSAVIESQASLMAASDWTRNSLGMAVTVDDTRYLSATNDDTTNWTASAGGTIDVGRDQASWTIAHLSLNESPRDFDNPGLTSAVPYTVDDIRLAYRSNFNRLSLEPAVDFFAERFAADIPGIPSQTYRNRNVLQPSLTARYEVAPMTNLVAVVRGASIDYLSAQAGQAKRNSTGFSVLTGLELDNGTLQTRLLAGYQQRNYASSQYGTIAAPIVEGSVSWTPSGVATYGAKLTRSVQDAADETVAAYTLTEGDATIDYELRTNVLLHGQTSLQVAHYAQGGGNTTQAGATLGATWLLNRNVTLSSTYTFLDSRSDKTPSYTDSLALLRLGLKL